MLFSERASPYSMKHIELFAKEKCLYCVNVNPISIFGLEIYAARNSYEKLKCCKITPKYQFSSMIFVLEKKIKLLPWNRYNVNT